MKRISFLIVISGQDRNPDDREAAEEKFKEITSAYQALTGSGGGAGQGGFGGGPGFGGPRGPGGFPGGGFTQADMDQADRIFREFFGGRSPEEVTRQQVTFCRLRRFPHADRCFSQIFRQAHRMQGGGFPGGGFPGGGFGGAGFGGGSQVMQEMHQRPDGTMVIRTTTISRNPDGTTKKSVTEQEMGKTGPGGFGGGRPMSKEEAEQMQQEMRNVGKQILKEVGKAAVSAAGTAIKDAASRQAKGVMDGIKGWFGGGNSGGKPKK